jgi:hypothetical protein
LLYIVDIENIPKQLNPFRLTQKNIAHEFGHTLGNVVSIKNMHGDEYKPKSSYYSDVSSLMNLGMELKARHFDYIVKEINTIMPNTHFILSL